MKKCFELDENEYDLFLQALYLLNVDYSNKKTRLGLYSKLYGFSSSASVRADLALYSDAIDSISDLDLRLHRLFDFNVIDNENSDLS